MDEIQVDIVDAKLRTLFANTTANKCGTVRTYSRLFLMDVSMSARPEYFVVM